MRLKRFIRQARDLVLQLNQGDPVDDVFFIRCYRNYLTAADIIIYEMRHNDTHAHVMSDPGDRGLYAIHRHHDIELDG